ncbi:efflux RND transporter periplasmic adaptor subunit [Zavarzinia sp. CC-PAN008]|uniref:efflux RND transporter periplasmic adaptor subunit n=1 Tax=Zavarzinia sp. CC-PAN008 TaxID=3243332 RepID=UPI003F74A6F1
MSARALRLSAVVGLAASLLAACGGEPPQARQEVVRPVKVTTVALTDQTQVSTYSGDVWPRMLSDLGFRVGGRVTERLVRNGDRVKAGDVLARLDPEDLRLSRRRAREAQAAATADRDQAKLEFERARTLFQRGHIAKAELDRRQTALDMANAALARSGTETAIAGNQLDYATLVADRDGVVFETLADVGQVVQAGQAVVRFAGTDAQEVVVNVPEARLAEFRDATDIRISLWSDESFRSSGTVREVAARADPATRTYAVRIALDTQTPVIAYGMTATVSVSRRLGEPAIILPSTALVESDGQAGVWVFDADKGAVALAPIQVDTYGSDSIVVRAGLQPGQEVVVAGVHKLDPGMKVRRYDSPLTLSAL